LAYIEVRLSGQIDRGSFFDPPGVSLLTRRSLVALLAALLPIAILTGIARAQTALSTALTYQGELQKAGTSASGPHE